jgi:hypothetical protein
VSEAWDAVHLSGWGYLTAATREIAVDAEYSTVIAGWGPDETYWLTGLVRETEGARALGAERPEARGDATIEPPSAQPGAMTSTRSRVRSSAVRAGALVAPGCRSRRDLDRGAFDLLVGDLREQVVDHVDPAPPLVFVVDLEPASLGDVGVHEHRVFRARIVLPLGDRQDVVGESFHRRIGSSLRERKRASCSTSDTLNQYFRAGCRLRPASARRSVLVEEPVVLHVGAVAHDVLDTRAVVPGAVHQDDLPGGGRCAT